MWLDLCLKMVVTFHGEGHGQGRAPHGGVPVLHPLPHGHRTVSRTWGPAPAGWTWILAPLQGGIGLPRAFLAAHWACIVCHVLRDTPVRQIHVSIVSVFVLSKEGKIIAFAHCLQTSGKRLEAFFLPLIFYPSTSTSPGFRIREPDCITSSSCLTTLFSIVYKHKRLLKFLQLSICAHQLLCSL